MAYFAKLQDKNGELPERSTIDSAGYDLKSVEHCIIYPGERKLIKTGLTCKMNNREYLSIVPRSGLALKQGITVLNTPGTVDADYYPNEIGVILYNAGNEIFDVHKGDRIAQAILCEYKTMGLDLVKNTERSGGFGSTGK